MGEHTIDNYNNLDAGANEINNAVGNLKTSLNNGTSAVNNIMNDSTFKGPIADHCAQVWGIINKATNSNLDSFSNNANTLRVINENYKETDKTVEDSVGGV